MKKEIIKKEKAPVIALFEQVGIKGISPDDSFSIKYNGNILEAQVKRASGSTETASISIKGRGFSQSSKFDPEHMLTNERNKLIRELNKKGDSQVSIAGKFGLSQAMISKIVHA